MMHLPVAYREIIAVVCSEIISKQGETVSRMWESEMDTSTLTGAESLMTGLVVLS